VLITGMPFIDGMFESMSSLTTTGLTMMQGTIDSAPASLIFWRSLLSWVGGIGIVVMALTGILATYTKSAKLMVAEGREERVKPNLRNTAKELWGIYILITALGVLMLYFSGMNLFNAVNYSMSAISTSGMDTTSQGLVGAHNWWLDISLIIIMFLGATSFSVHYLFLKRKQFGAYFRDIEFKIMVMLSVFSIILIMPKMLMFYGSNSLGIENAVFHVVSAFTCGGFALVPMGDIFKWEDFIKVVLVGLMFIGGAAGSTAGGIKISRFWIFVKSIYWRVKSAILPRESFFQRKFEGRVVKEQEVKEISQFILLYAVFIIAGVFVLTSLGNDLSNSLFEVVSAQSNSGISTGITHAGMPFAGKVMLILNMWIGRLEIIPILAGVGFLLSLRRD